MLKKLGIEHLRSGNSMDIFLLTPPDARAMELLSFLQHKSDDSRRGIKARLSGAYANTCTDHYFFASIDGKIAGVLWYGYGRNPLPIANFGHVFTAPEYRGQGIATILLQYFRHSFATAPVLAAFCTCSQEWIAKMYLDIGFTGIIPGTKAGKLMLVNPPGSRNFAELLQEYYNDFNGLHLVPGTASWRHELDCLGQFANVFTSRCFLSRQLNNFQKALFLQEDGAGQVKVILNSHKRCVGWCFAMNLSGDQGARPFFDFELHNAIPVTAAGTILSVACRELEVGMRPMLAGVLASQSPKSQILQQCGFQSLMAIPEYMPADKLLLLARN